MATIDCFTYNGELAVLKLHLHILEPFVDKFIICEAKTTFTGKKKPLYFSEHEHFVKRFWRKIDYYIIDEKYTQGEKAIAENSPNTVGARHWKTEFLQKESLLKALDANHVRPDDTVYIGDVDEIWQPYYGPTPAKLKLRVYAYRLDNRSDEEFWGTLVAPLSYLQGKILNHERSRTDIRTQDFYGWHFTSMGGEREVRRKLDDSYTPESYNSREVQELLSSRLQNNQDYIGRAFKFSRDTSEWPEYLKNNKHRFRRLLRNPVTVLGPEEKILEGAKATSLLGTSSVL